MYLRPIMEKIRVAPASAVRLIHGAKLVSRSIFISGSIDAEIHVTVPGPSVMSVLPSAIRIIFESDDGASWPLSTITPAVIMASASALYRLATSGPRQKPRAGYD